MNDSLIEIALREMKSKRKPRTLAKIAKDVFEVKGINPKEADKILAQFQMDFMLSGYFICCGEDKNGIKLWDLKNRQPSTLLDKDGSYLEEFYEDEEVAKNELKDDIVYKQSLVSDFEDDLDADDEEDDEAEEPDEIEEELLEEGLTLDEEDEDNLEIDEVDEEELDEDDLDADDEEDDE